MYILEESPVGHSHNTLIELIAMKVNPTHEITISALETESGNTSSAILYRITKEDAMICAIHGFDQELGVDSLGELVKLVQDEGGEITEVIKRKLHLQIK
jgi:hypothetical protein